MPLNLLREQGIGFFYHGMTLFVDLDDMCIYRQILLNHNSKAEASHLRLIYLNNCVRLVHIIRERGFSPPLQEYKTNRW